MADNNQNLIEVRNLTKHFPMGAGVFGGERDAVRAVDDVSFSIRRGETFGLVGESGCGKSTTGRCILRLIEPTSGSVQFDGHDLLTLSADHLRRLRRDIQIIFQDPYSSLNPRMTVGQIVEEPLIVHRIGDQPGRSNRVAELLQLVGLEPEHADRYPHEFSGGQRQRIGIARALALQPEFIVCDEPVSALDVSMQAQIVNLLLDLQDRFGLSYLFIAHDLAVVRSIAKRVAVMYAGSIIEQGPKGDIYRHPKHPYTRALLDAVPRPDPERERKPALGGEIPSILDPPPGCTFSARCPLATEHCRIEPPIPREVEPGRMVACHLA
jgi:oligopeptide/dipeptide ABC transporter ATP-binding protein